MGSAQIRTLAKKAYRNNGFTYTIEKGASYGFFRTVETLQKHLPGKCLSSLNDVNVNLPNYRYRPWYEGGIVTHLKKAVRPTDTIVTVGGGFGVSAVVGARRAIDGEVIVFEPNDEMVSIIRETAKLNGVQDRITVRQCGVGEIIQTRGESTNATAIDVEDLPQCDVLELDCEGAERTILRQLQTAPREIIVESHHNLDSPREAIEQLLRKRDYEVKSSLNHVGDPITREMANLEHKMRYQSVLRAVNSSAESA